MSITIDQFINGLHNEISELEKEREESIKNTRDKFNGKIVEIEKTKIALLALKALDWNFIDVNDMTQTSCATTCNVKEGDILVVSEIIAKHLESKFKQHPFFCLVVTPPGLKMYVERNYLEGVN